MLICLTGCQLVFEAVPPDASQVDTAIDTAIDSNLALRLVAHYEMESAAGGVVTDTAGGHDATCELSGCPVEQTGEIGGALSFDGIDDVLTVASTSTLETLGTEFTVTMWIDPAPGSGLTRCIAAKPVLTGAENSWALCMTSARGLVFFSTHEPSMSNTSTIATAVLQEGQGFRHVAIVWTGTLREIFLDGVVVAAEVVTGIVRFDGNPIRIGADANSSAPALHFSGAIDELRIYNGALSAAEIAVLATRERYGLSWAL